MINTKLILPISLIAIFIIYYIFLPFNKIVNLILNEYITIYIIFILVLIYQYFKVKLKDKLLFEFIPNTNYIPIKSTFIFFVIFQVVDYNLEGGFIGMINQWFMYWIFGLVAFFITHNINFYKNYKAYKAHKHL